MIDKFPDGKPLSEWFKNNSVLDEIPAGRPVFSTDRYGIIPDRPDILQTEAIQRVIDLAAKHNGIVRFTAGRYLSGSLFFKPGTALHLDKDATLCGSQEVADFPLLSTRIEGENVTYFAALINADKCDNFTISGSGTIDGCGAPFWRHFWIRKKFNPGCTNMDEMRPRLIYISNSDDVHISSVHIRNSPFWSSHYYNCRRLKLTGLTITSPAEPVPAPSTDGIDLDVCSQVLISGCFISVNDDAIALKGGKGPDADQRPENGGNSEILIENCRIGRSHNALTCGSETIHNRNVIMRNCTVDRVGSFFHLKMRPDTPQMNEFIRIENVSGNCRKAFWAYSWTQFRRSPELFPGTGQNIQWENIELKCENVFVISQTEEYELKNISIKNCSFISSEPCDTNFEARDAFEFSNVSVNGKLLLAPEK